jgi:hypothetical protein
LTNFRSFLSWTISQFLLLTSFRLSWPLLSVLLIIFKYFWFLLTDFFPIFDYFSPFFHYLSTSYRSFLNFIISNYFFDNFNQVLTISVNLWPTFWPIFGHYRPFLIINDPFTTLYSMLIYYWTFFDYFRSTFDYFWLLSDSFLTILRTIATIFNFFNHFLTGFDHTCSQLFLTNVCLLFIIFYHFLPFLTNFWPLVIIFDYLWPFCDNFWQVFDYFRLFEIDFLPFW